MDFGILGPFQVTFADGLRNITGLREQVALVTLLLNANRVVGINRIIDEIWGDDAPATARSQVQICVSSLRRQLKDDPNPPEIVTQRPGYLLRLDKQNLDEARFDAQVAVARADLANGQIRRGAAGLRDALAMWRGNALDGLPGEMTAAYAARLNDKRLAVTEEWLKAELELGHHAEVLPEIGRMVDEFPLREHFRELLMLGLCRAGRSVEALQEFRRTRDLLVEELGIEPSPALQRLELAILEGDANLAVPEQDTEADGDFTIPRMLPNDIADFTGREDIVAKIAAELTKSDRFSPAPISVITGPGGAGKTALAVHIAQHVAADQFPDGLLYVDLHGTTQPVGAGQALESFLRALGVSGNILPDDTDQRAGLFRAALADRRVLLVLDDAASEEQITPLLPGSGPSAVLVTSRRRLTAQAGANRTELGLMSLDNALDLLRLGAGPERVDAAPEDSAALVKLCGCLPLAIRIISARLAARAHWPISRMVSKLANETHRLDELRYEHLEVRASLAISYESLTPEAQRLLRSISLLDVPDLPAWLAGPLLDIDPDEAEDLIDDVTESFLLDATSRPRPGREPSVRYQIPDLVRSFARERVVAEHTASERMAVLERALGALLFLAEEAHRRVYGGDHLVIRSGAPLYPMNDAAFGVMVEHPLDWLELERDTVVACVRQAAAIGAVDLCWNLALRSVTLFEARALYSHWRESHEVALAACREAGNLLGQAAILYSLASLAMFRQRYREAAEQLREAERQFEQIGHRQGTALALRNITHVERVTGRLGAALEIGDRALAMFRELNDRAGEAHLLRNLALTHLDAGADDEALRCIREACAISTEAGLHRIGVQARHTLAEIHLAAGRVEDAIQTLTEVRETVARSGDDLGLCFALLVLGEAERRRDPVVAVQRLQEAGRLAVALNDDFLFARTRLSLAELALDEGDVQQAGALAEPAVATFGRLGIVLRRAHALAVLGDVQRSAGRPDAARKNWATAAELLRVVNVTDGSPLDTELSRSIHARLAMDEGDRVATRVPAPSGSVGKP